MNMCEQNIFYSVIFHIYNLIWIGLPIAYLIAFKVYKSKNKVYIKAFIYALIMCLVLYIPKFIGYRLPNSCYNCAINNECTAKEVKEEKRLTTKATSKTTTTTTTTTKTTTNSTTTTTKKKNSVVYNGDVKIETIDGVTFVNGLLIVNKTYPLPSDYVPKNTYKDASSYKDKVCNDCIDKEAYAAWKEMKADALAVGLNLWIQSGYRPYLLQQNLYNGYVKRDGKAAADRYSARAGYSEHQTGLCFDINNPSSSFNDTEEAKWIDNNAYKYGFILRYPKGKEDETGYMYESWHVRYVGKDLASTLYNDGDWITLEDYFNLTSKYAN